jgi:ABC-2 type transport system ATP-binding protein/lipopolysaccharide transport system ATP-binding protein
MARIKLANVNLDFPIYGANTRSLKKQFLRVTTGGTIKQPDSDVVAVSALSDLSLEINSGEVLGLIGHNGAGKSSLLRVLAGIYEPQGKITIDGRVSALLDVSLGMDDEATGYENIYLSGIIRGLTPKEIAAKKADIAEFTELGDYLAMPIRTYSSGMRLRLAFSIATSFSSEILVIDEVVGAGDDAFMVKAKKRLEELMEKSEIVVLASHSEEVIRKLCNKVLWLEAGQKQFLGDTEEGLRKYAKREK